MPEQEAIERLRAELTEAVRIRLRSDVPLGAFLSGGMDSAAVLALMTQQSTQPIKTFTIGFGDPAYDELADARATALHFHADHHEHIVTPDCVRVAETLALHYDEPFADASAIPTFYVAELARRQVTVCLTGDGGDELFAGYTPYADALTRVASGAVSAVRSVINPDYLLASVVEGDILRAGGALPERRAVDDIRTGRGTLLSRLQTWDRHHYLPDDILVKVDRATMAHSLEARCPILDHRVVELAARQSSARHSDGTTLKRLFREVIAPWVPPAVLDRPKRGFGVPLRRWFQEQMTDWARDILLDSRSRQRGWTRTTEVSALLNQHEAGSRDHAKRIWALVCLELWARAHVDRVAGREQACA